MIILGLPWLARVVVGVDNGKKSACECVETALSAMDIEENVICDRRLHNR